MTVTGREDYCLRPRLRPPCRVEVPVPEGAHIEGSGDLTCDAAIEDCHLLVADPEARRLYELYQATQEGEGLSAGGYHDLGITEFVLSGHPHLEEAYWVGEGVLPELGRRGCGPTPPAPPTPPAAIPFAQ